jgi:hypothetical protein
VLCQGAAISIARVLGRSEEVLECELLSICLYPFTGITSPAVYIDRRAITLILVSVWRGKSLTFVDPLPMVSRNSYNL